MQLSLPRLALWSAATWLVAAPVGADSSVTLGTSAFRESGGPMSMTVLIPTANMEVDLSEGVGVHGGWTADVVTGASVAVVDAPADDVDAITTATLSDIRHVFGGGVDLRDDAASLSLSYGYGFENDYRSHAIDLTARTELYDRNTSLEIGYGRGFDSVCDSSGADEPVTKQRLDSSDGCFGGGDERQDRSLDVQSFSVGWSQNWTRLLTSQSTLTAQLLNGFQANPYRAVLIGRTAAQEHHPTNRARYALGTDLRYWVEPLQGALQGHVGLYRDTWDIESLSLEGGYEQVIGKGFRARGRVRYYTQSAAAFYSDDYVLAPRGQYFTGDRELSTMQTGMLGIQFLWSAPADDEGEVLGFLTEFELVLKGNVLKSWFDDFHYDRVDVPNDLALFGSFGIAALF